MKSTKKAKPDQAEVENGVQLEHTIKVMEYEVIELETQLTENIRLRRRLENDIKHLNEQLIRLEQIKVNEKASVSLWKVLAAVAAAIGALIMSIFDRNDK